MPIIYMPIEQRNTGKGSPNAVLHYDRPLNNRQKRLLEHLRKYGDFVIVNKSDVNMRDLSALTAAENVEFAMFTNKGKRMIIRGDRTSVNIDINKARELNAAGWRWRAYASGNRFSNINPFRTG